ncbi:MAG: hypothetical protein J6V40_00350 [Clostridia bacterium]|nr:hypothetical protein [Clostridia bacterium]
MFKKKKPFPKYEHYNSIVDELGIESSAKKAFGGQSEKMFVRLDSDYLDDFFEEILAGNTSYVTYLDDVMHEFFTTKKPPVKAISLMMKYYDNGCKYGYMEDMGSRVANLLQIPVVYNKTFKEGSIHYLLSIDFMKYDSNLRYGTLEGDYFKSPYDSHASYTLNYWFNFFDAKVLLDPETGKVLNDPNRMSLFRSFVPSYFFRKYIIEDPDFDLQNMCVIYNRQDNRCTFGPNYDMERAFVKERDNYAFDYALERDIKLAYELCPDIIRPLMKRITHVHNKGLINNALLSNISAPLTRHKICNRLKRNIEDVAKAHYMVRQSMQEGM